MQLQYDFTPEDYRRFNTYFVKNDPATKRKKLRTCVIMPVIYLALAAATRLMGDTSSFPVIMACVGAIWLLAFPFYWDYCTRQRENKVIKEGRATGSFGPHTLVANAEGVTVTTDTMKNEIKWKAINKIVPAADCVFLHLTSASAIIVPNSAFSGSDTQEQFLEETLRYREQAAGIVEVL